MVSYERFGKYLENFEARGYFRLSKVYEELKEEKLWVSLLIGGIEK